MKIKEIKEFLAGQQDCMKGRPPIPGESGAYHRGYRMQYEANAMTDAASIAMEPDSAELKDLL